MLFSRLASRGQPLAQVPPEYGGTSPDALGRSPEERALMALATSLGPTSLSPATAATTSVPRNGSSVDDGSGGGDDGDGRGGRNDAAVTAEAGPESDVLLNHGSTGAGVARGGSKDAAVLP